MQVVKETTLTVEKKPVALIVTFVQSPYKLGQS